MPYIYPQIPGNNEAQFVIRYPFPTAPSNSLVFVLPLRNSVEVTSERTNKLIFRYPTGEGYATKEYTIFIEGINGALTHAGEHALIANRLAMFRFLSTDPDKAILVNNSYHNTLGLSHLSVSQSTHFGLVPTVGTNDELALNSELKALEDRVKKLEEMIIVGEEDAEEALQDKPEGTIYIQLERDNS